MRSVIGILMTSLTVFILSGCAGGEDIEDFSKIYYIVDGTGLGVSGIEYNCDSGTSGITRGLGGFVSDAARDNCILDLHTNLITGDIYLEDINGGLNNVQFDCQGNAANPDLSDITIFNGVQDGYIVNASHYLACTLKELP
jgi:hypothetical protein